MPETPIQTWRANRSPEYLAAVYDTAKRVNDMQSHHGQGRALGWEALPNAEQENLAEWIELVLTLHQGFLAERELKIQGGRDD
ncbi:hypothetical protein [Frondihabitans australicus]|uniref:Uncharacterized protein n=1 Tax=Frondihabitans australicus TaxID=386892 RepID=A0A495IGH3_9MICO|nr:hypothetical protein [Frondihabitans australicus]RKR74760.1 hypothetical protein C8E83_1889 [Frondihabitans australicus]